MHEREQPRWQHAVGALLVLLLGLVLLQVGWASLETSLYAIVAQLPQLATGMMVTLFAFALIAVFPCLVATPDRARQILRKVATVLAIIGILIISIAHFLTACGSCRAVVQRKRGGIPAARSNLH